MTTAVDPRSKKEQKYDRQIRLWGLHGQSLLESANIALIGANAVGCETLKNLVLPAVGSFTIVDGKKVTEADMGSNFFVDKDGLGQSRAKVTQELLSELNPDVKGAFVDEDIATILKDKPDFFKQFNFIIASEVSDSDLIALDKVCWEAKIPLVVVRAVGFVGYCRLVSQDHWVVEQHPSVAHPDLRCHDPFPELQEEANRFADLDKLTPNDYKHVAFPLLLIILNDQWRKAHAGNLPKTSKEKAEYKAILKEHSLRYSECENFEQAYAKAFLSWSYDIPGEFTAVMNDERCSSAEPQSSLSDFWVIARAVKEFMAKEGDGKPPLEGAIPDMAAHGRDYARLQEIYRNKSLAHVAAVKAHVQAILEKIGRDRDSIPDATISRFCKTSRQAWNATLRPIHREYEAPNKEAAELAYMIGEDVHMDLYFVLRGSARFHTTHGRYPGVDDAEYESDVPKLAECVKEVVKEAGISRAVDNDLIHEMCRYGNNQVHGTAAYIGGLAAGEITKMITHQFVPFNNTFIFNGVKGTGACFEM